MKVSSEKRGGRSKEMQKKDEMTWTESEENKRRVDGLQCSVTADGDVSVEVRREGGEFRHVQSQNRKWHAIKDSLLLLGIYALVYEFIMLTQCSSTDIKSLKWSLRLLFKIAIQRDQSKPNSWLASDKGSVNYLYVQMDDRTNQHKVSY